MQGEVGENNSWRTKGWDARDQKCNKVTDVVVDDDDRKDWG